MGASVGLKRHEGYVLVLKGRGIIKFNDDLRQY
jgi:hypothetical protein